VNSAFIDLVSNAPKVKVSVNNIRNCFHGRQIEPVVYRPLELGILENGFWADCRGAYFIRDPKGYMYDALGGNHRAVVGRGPKCGMEGRLIPWKETGEIARREGLIPVGKTFSLTPKVLDALLFAIKNIETGTHERSLQDECRYFRRIVETHFNKAGDVKEEEGFDRLIFDIPTLYGTVFDKDLSDGRGWALPKREIKRRELVEEEARRAGLPPPVHEEVSAISTFYSGYGPNPAKAIKEVNILAALWNENAKCESARTIVRGLKFFWTHKDIEDSLADYCIRPEKTMTILQAIGKMPLKNSNAWAAATRKIPKEERATSGRFENIKRESEPNKEKPSGRGETIGDARFKVVLEAAC